MLRSFLDSIWFFPLRISILLFAATNMAWAQPVLNLPELPQMNTVSPAAILLSKYVSIPSETGNEKEAADFLVKQCSDRGLIINQFTSNTGSSNFAASIYPLNLCKPNIIFLNHMDVVPAGQPNKWKYPPYKGCIEDAKVWGRGSFDNKGLAIIQLSAIEQFVHLAKNIDLPYNITLLCVSGEETGGDNGSALMSKNFKEVFTPVVVIGEGGSGMEEVNFLPKGKTFFGISVAEKHTLWLKLSCELHVAGHASVVGSEYANMHMIKGLYKLVKTRQPIKMTKEAKLMFRDAGKKVGGFRGFTLNHFNWLVFRPFLNHYINKNPELKSILCNTITISNLGDLDIYPNQNKQESIAMVDCRLLPGTSTSDFIALISKRLKDSLVHISVLHEGPKQITTHPEFFFNQLEKSIQKTFSGSEVVPILFPASNDNSYFRAEDCPVYGLNPMILSPVQIKSIHNSNEYIDLEDLDKGIEVFRNFLQTVLMLPGSDLSSDVIHQQ